MWIEVGSWLFAVYENDYALGALAFAMRMPSLTRRSRVSWNDSPHLAEMTRISAWRWAGSLADLKSFVLVMRPFNHIASALSK